MFQRRFQPTSALSQSQAHRMRRLMAFLTVFVGVLLVSTLALASIPAHAIAVPLHSLPPSNDRATAPGRHLNQQTFQPTVWLPPSGLESVSGPQRPALAARAALLASSSIYTPTFTPHYFGGGTFSIAAGDMNGDGALDIVESHYGETGTLYLNDGHGGFAVGAPFGSANNTQSVALGDVNGDGALDVVVGNQFQQSVVYINDGHGGFGPGVPFGGANETFSIALGDVNGDGALDIVQGNSGQQSVIYLNDGSGHFYTGSVNCANPPNNVRCIGTPSDNTVAIALGDVNGDGMLDVVQDNSLQQSRIYLNDGHGGFGAGVPFGIKSSGSSIALGDVNGDGTLDIVQGGDYGQQSGVYLNDGSGHFYTGSIDCANPPNNVRCFGTLSDDTPALALGDVNGDGALDIIQDNNSEPSKVYLNLNDGTGRFGDGLPFSGANGSLSVALADVNGDGALDIIQGNYDRRDIAFFNDGQGGWAGAGVPFGDAHLTASIALGDVNGDGALDIVQGSGCDLINTGQCQMGVVYWNNGLGGFGAGVPFGSADNTTSIAIGDVNGDGALDIVQGKFDPFAPAGLTSTINLNNGHGGFSGAGIPFGDGNIPYGSGGRLIALGDVNGDGALDIVQGNQGERSVVFLNDGSGHFYAGAVNCTNPPGNVRCFGTVNDSTSNIKLGDVNGDGALDIVQGQYGVTSTVYLNDGHGNFTIGTPFGGAYLTTDIALGDMNGDGTLDIVQGIIVQQSMLYLNDGHGGFNAGQPFGGSNPTVRVTVGDVNGDGALDIVEGNQFQQSVVYVNDGHGGFGTGTPFGGENQHPIFALGDVNGDGALDIVQGTPSVVYRNTRFASAGLPSSFPSVVLHRPGRTADANFFSASDILSSRVIPITYKVFDREGVPARIRAFYSLDGGGKWLPAVAAQNTAPLAPYRVYLPLIATRRHNGNPAVTRTYLWDTFASGFFGESDNVVFRIEAYPSLTTPPNGVPVFQHPYASATTFPFRVRGTQIRVLSGTIPISNAIVYRLPAGQSVSAQPFADGSGRPFRTDNQGYLLGRGQSGPGDRLVALYPIRATDSYTLYATNATPTLTGLNMYTVTQSGVQTLTVSAANPLILFNLDVSLEWDARQDTQFMTQLKYNLQRASDFLYDWTNGQAALGNVRVYHDRQQWDNAHIQIYATNRLRPNAAQGGIVSAIITDPVTSTITYDPGQVRIGSVWDRYGDTTGSLGEDWPRALAHELGHYALFLDDDYLGLDANNNLIPIDTCSNTAMSDPYREDYSEFHFQDRWSTDCANALAAKETGRWDWKTITTFYPWLNGVITNTGPSGLPLNVTQIDEIQPITPSTVIPVPIFNLTQDGAKVQPGPTARAILYQTGGDRLIDLGNPTLDQVDARGARLGDRLCIYEVSAQRLGCETLTAGNEELALVSHPDWNPGILVSPVTSRTIDLSVNAAGLPPTLTLSARLYPIDDVASSIIVLTNVPATTNYTGTFNLLTPAPQGYVQVWVNESGARRETIADYSLGGSPAFEHGRGAFEHGRGAFEHGRGAPVQSTDGQVVLFGDGLIFNEGEFFALQAVTTIPSQPSGTTLVGRAYRLSKSAGAPNLVGTSISFNYAGRDVPPGEENFLHVYFFDGAAWQRLPTTVDTNHNLAVAAVPATANGAGLYALLSGIELPLYGPGWNQFTYPAQGSKPVTQALASIDGAYGIVYGKSLTDTLDPWKVYAVGVPGWVDDLATLDFAQSYWISVTKSITLQVTGGPSAPTALLSPPMTVYGSAPFAGVVTAWVNGLLCGQGATQLISGQLVYTLNIQPDGPGGASGCGAAGSIVTFKIGAQALSTSIGWNIDRVWNLPLTP